MPAYRRAVFTGSIALLVFVPAIGRAMPSSFAPLVKRVAPTIVGISVVQFAGSGHPPQPRLSVPIRARLC